jgi:FtsP/CotA-like multicopper oxidase with cupredoxin domain
MKKYKIKILILCTIFLFQDASAESRTIDLVVDYKTVDFAGEYVQALAINDQIPAPTLRFKEGDDVIIKVHNHLKEGTTIHWHGLLVPWMMDGVENLSQEPIPPGQVFTYTFKLKQSGTYWYHSHAGLQEQQGLYGGFIIDPLDTVPYTYTKDLVVVLSDWSNTKPDQIFANLKKDGDYYNPRMPLQPSITKFIADYSKGTHKEQSKLISDYEMMQDMRMNIYDLADVAYDAYLLNGHPASHPWTSQVQVGDIVRLRFIGAAASTNYRVKIHGASMEIVHVQGHDVVPLKVDDFTISPGETTDVLVKIEQDQPYIIYAESADTLGAAMGALITQTCQQVDYRGVPPFPTPAPVMMGHSHQLEHPAKGESKGHEEHAAPKKTEDHQGNGSVHHSPDHVMHDSHEKKSVDVISLTKGTKYQNLKSLQKTNDPTKPVQEIHMELSGYMDRFMWFINGKPESEAELILIKPGQRYRIRFTNSSMMIHPMHIHGHFFILRNGNGAYDPFLHTIEVPPGATVVADFDADTSGQWFFHCHHLYHMMAGMSRVFRYTTFFDDQEKGAPQPMFIKHPMGHPSHLYRSTLLDFGYDPFNNIMKGNLDFLWGSDTHKLQLYSEDAEVRKGKVESADLDIFYWYVLSEFWSIKGGVNYFYKPSHKPYFQPGLGIEGLFPYFIETNLRMYLHEGSVKADLQLSRDTQIAHNTYIRLGARGVMATQAVRRDEIGRGLNYIEYIVRPYYTVKPGMALFAEFDFTQDYRNLKDMISREGQSTHEKILMLGVSLLF